MTISTGSDSDKKYKPDDLAGPFGVLGYLERRAKQIMESRQAIVRIAGAIRDTMLNIWNLLAGSLSAGGQAELERAVGNLQGLTKAADQASVAAPSNSGDSVASRGVDVDLTGIKSAVDAHRDSSNANASQATSEGGLHSYDGNSRKASTKAKALSALDATMTVEENQTKAKNSDVSTPSDSKPPVSDAPVSDAPVSKVDRFKQAFATGDSKADPSPPVSSDLPLPATSPSARSNAASLKLDHAEATNAYATSKVDVSASAAAPIEPPKEGAPKAQQNTAQPTNPPRKPPVLAAT